MTNRQETLIVVTADHSHTMTINGYSHRGNNLLGIHRGYITNILLIELAFKKHISNNESNLMFKGLSDDIGDDQLPYVTLSYANGPGYNTTFANGERINLTDVDTSNYSNQNILKLYN